VGERDATGRDWPSANPEEDTIWADAVKGTDPDVDSFGSPVSSSVASEPVFFSPFSAEIQNSGATGDGLVKVGSVQISSPSHGTPDRCGGRRRISLRRRAPAFGWSFVKGN